MNYHWFHFNVPVKRQNSTKTFFLLLVILGGHMNIL